MDPRQLRRKPIKNEDDLARPDRLEAIAMRRIVVEMGYWLSPLLKDHPLPVLSEWERTVNLTELHNKPSWNPTKLDLGKSVLERMDAKNPRKEVNTMHLRSQSKYDKNSTSRALMSYERLTDAERQAVEDRKEEKKRAEVAERQARMKEVEVSLRPVLDQEEQDRIKAKAAAKRAEREAEEARQRSAAEAAAKRRETIEMMRAMPDEARKALVRERKRARDREREKTRQRAPRSRAKTKAEVEAPVEKKPVGRPPMPKVLNLEPTNAQLPAIEVAMQMPLHKLYEQYLGSQMSSVVSKAGVQHKVLTDAELKAAAARFEAKLDDLIAERPDFLYQWKARIIEHHRAKAIVKRERKRGVITSAEEAAKVLGMLSPGTTKPKLGGLPKEVKSERRREKMKEYNRQWRERQRAKKEG